MIQSFSDLDTRQLWEEERSRRYSAIARTALRKLIQLHAAEKLSDLQVPPGNRLEPLKGNRAGHHSVRINDQWRLCFRWTETGPAEVEIVDYH